MLYWLSIFSWIFDHVLSLLYGTRNILSTNRHVFQCALRSLNEIRESNSPGSWTVMTGLLMLILGVECTQWPFKSKATYQWSLAFPAPPCVSFVYAHGSIFTIEYVLLSNILPALSSIFLLIDWTQ